jgi:hypothetical protein
MLAEGIDNNRVADSDHESLLLPSKEIDAKSIEEKVASMLSRLACDHVLCESLIVNDLHSTEDSHMPPPKPCFVKNAQPQSSPGLLTNLVRSQSLSPRSRGQTARSFVVSRNMSQSMPNLQSTRSTHNRSMGLTSLLEPSKLVVSEQKAKLQSRMEEFESLLEDL